MLFSDLQHKPGINMGQLCLPSHQGFESSWAEWTPATAYPASVIQPLHRAHKLKLLCAKLNMGT